jgi:hypothetical protein
VGAADDAETRRETARIYADERLTLNFPAVPIVVDIQAIEDFAALLTQELDANFRPSHERVVLQHSDGVGFGSRHASIDMQMAVRKYFDCLATAVDNLRGFVAASNTLIDAAQRIAAAYRSADADARTMQRSIDQALSDAVRAAEMAKDRRRGHYEWE